MRYHVLATDYDGTLAHDGVVSTTTINALKRFISSGRHLIMVTGRELPELKSVFSELSLFRWVVAENGGLLYEPSTKKETPLGDAPSEKLVAALISSGVAPMSVGQTIIATWSPFEHTVLELIRELGLELQVIFNKGAVMVLPGGVNKATGLQRALDEMKLSRHNTVGIGDAENDHSFLQIVEFSAAVANALPSLQEAVDFVVPLDHGLGVEFLIDKLLADDLTSFHGTSLKHRLPIATSENEEICLPAYGGPTLICGPSGSGKSTLATRIVDIVTQEDYQFCLIDPEGDYESLEGAVVIGGPEYAPPIDESLHALEKPETNVVVCLTGVPIPDRPDFFSKLMTGLTRIRSETGRPHWLLLDEAHHLIPADWRPTNESLPANGKNVVLITVQPSLLPISVLRQVENLLIVGNDSAQFVLDFASVTGVEPPELPTATLEDGEVLLWTIGQPSRVRLCKAIKSVRQHHRHRRKYAEGELPPDRSFYFRGPDDLLNLRAQNLILFCQLADGIDDVTWQFHLHNGDYSRWFADSIKDDNLAAEAERIRQMKNSTAKESKKLIQEAIQRDYTLPTQPPKSIPRAS